MARSKITKRRAARTKQKKTIGSGKAVSKKKAAKSKTKAIAKPPRAGPAARAAGPAVRAAGLANVTLADPKNTAVNNCVNSKMDAAMGAGNWNDSGHMDSDYRFDSHSIRAFLNDVRGCLKPTYDLNINDVAFINACLTAQVYRLKRLVYNQAKP